MILLAFIHNARITSREKSEFHQMNKLMIQSYQIIELHENVLDSENVFICRNFCVGRVKL